MSKNLVGQRPSRSTEVEALVISAVEGLRVLHVGCVGTLHPDASRNFRMHRALADATKDLVGIDVHDEGVRRMQDEGFDVRLADATTFATDERFDAVVALSMLQFLKSPVDVLQNLGRALVPDGRLVVSVPNAYSFLNTARGLVRHAVEKPVQESGQSDIGEVSIFTSSSLHAVVRAAGFRVERIATAQAKGAWEGDTLRERSRNFANYAPGSIVKRLRPTLVCFARR